MITMSAGDIAALTGGRLEAIASRTVIDGPMVVDSRLCTAGSLFACVPGEHTDGHLYVTDAFRRGAVVALANRPIDGPSIVVDDTVRALGFLAGGVLRRTTGCRVIGVTGSSGKTSTKDLIGALVARAGSTVAAKASMNNEIGLPLTVLQVEESTQHLVLEYSARGIGHIEYLCRIARPAIAVVLNVGSAHLGEFGSREVVAAAKGELVAALPTDGLAVLCVDDPLVAAMRFRTSAPTVGFGRSPDADVRVEDLTLDENARPRFRLVTPEGSTPVAMQLTGAHQALNASAAAAVGLAVGMTVDEIGDVLSEAVTLSPHRMQVTTRDDGLVVVDDSYNANPESVRVALDALATVSAGRAGSSWAVLGEMRELGADGADLHAEVGRHAAGLGIDHLVVVGDDAQAIAVGARAVSDWSGDVEVVPSAEEATALLEDSATGSDVVLVKASNALSLWRIVEALLRRDRHIAVTDEAGR